LQPNGGRTDKQRARRVHTLGAAGEEGRALAAVTSSRPAPRTAETLHKLKSLFPVSSSGGHFVASLGTPTPPRQELRQQVEEEVLKLLRRPPKLTAPGLLGTRLEHLAACSEDAALAFGEVPPAV
jgi:hypothetical protein